MATTIDDDAIQLAIYYDDGWWPCITESVARDLHKHVMHWAKKHQLSNMDMVLTVSQITTPVD